MGTCRHSNAKMGEILGCTRSRIAAQLKRLVDDGFVEIINPGSAKTRAIQITEKTEKVLKANSQSIIDESRKQASNNKSKSKRLENEPSNDPINEPFNPIQEAHKRAQNKNSLSNNNYEDIISSDSSVGFQPPSKSKRKTHLIDVENLSEIISTPRGIQSVSVKGLPEQLILDASEVFIARFEKEKFKTKGQLQYAFVDFLQEYYMKEEKPLPF